jgi:1-acyl-sn-glycerol-3-phosphate acyltransferase
VRFGEPVNYAERYADRLDDPLLLRQVTDEIMFEIRELSRQQYVDRYASRSAAPPSPPPTAGGSAETPEPRSRVLVESA